MRESTESLIAPFWMYLTSSAASPCAKTTSPRPILHDLSCRACRFEIRLRIERRGRFGTTDRVFCFVQRDRRHLIPCGCTVPAGIGFEAGCPIFNRPAPEELSVSVSSTIRRASARTARVPEFPLSVSLDDVNRLDPSTGRAGLAQHRRGRGNWRKPSPESAASTRSRAAGCRKAGRRSSAAGLDPARRCWRSPFW